MTTAIIIYLMGAFPVFFLALREYSYYELFSRLAASFVAGLWWPVVLVIALWGDND